MTRDRGIAAKVIVISLVPLVGFTAAFLVLKDSWQMTDSAYERYRAFWGGAPSEVFSHWLNMVLMSGNAVMLAWLTSAEAFLRRSGDLDNGFRRFLNVAVAVTLLASGLVGVVLDTRHGEGAVLLSYPIFFLPILLSSAYTLRKFTAIMSWKPWPVAKLSTVFALVHVAAQFFYEPSSTGGPNLLIIPLWLGSPAVAIWTAIRDRKAIRLIETTLGP